MRCGSVRRDPRGTWGKNIVELGGFNVWTIVELGGTRLKSTVELGGKHRGTWGKSAKSAVPDGLYLCSMMMTSIFFFFY
ncbi:hypothetical protein SAMN00790413_05011 [Deinococcus hopiensis KR-140]|uniref:Uncharacterized protein n=1 Tax=Deinococcus hopiensis KR-140 TaxID=695939 RepID=A0A1W1USY0_9DEIO|nr:hypothetical protein SAMN00790413_05011 [Deinococcus hopiensis KR-140]